MTNDILNEKDWHEKEMNHMMGWKGRGMVHWLTTNPTYVVNPEFAFGIVRKMAAKNKLDNKQILHFLLAHPAWSQVTTHVDNRNNLNSLFLSYCKESGVVTQKKNSKETYLEHNIQFALHAKGKALVTHMTDAGIKTEEVTLGFDLVLRGKNTPDTRPLLSMNVEGSNVRYRFLRMEDEKPNMAANNDKLIRRLAPPSPEGSEQESSVTMTLVESNNSKNGGSDLISQLLAGETLSNF